MITASAAGAEMASGIESSKHRVGTQFWLNRYAKFGKISSSDDGTSRQVG